MTWEARDLNRSSGLGMPDMEPGLPEGPVAAPAEAGGGTTTQNDGGSAMMA